MKNNVVTFERRLAEPIAVHVNPRGDPVYVVLTALLTSGQLQLEHRVERAGKRNL